MKFYILENKSPYGIFKCIQSAVKIIMNYKLTVTERGKLEKISLEDECDYDTKTVASAIKFYFRSDIFCGSIVHCVLLFQSLQ